MFGHTSKFAQRKIIYFDNKISTPQENCFTLFFFWSISQFLENKEHTSHQKLPKYP